MGRRALFVDGVVQSVAPEDAADGYWSAMLPTAAPGSALLLGVGGGTVLHLLLRRFGALPIVGVDNSAAMLATARVAFGALPACVDLVEADASSFIYTDERRFGYVAVDLYSAEKLARGILALPFLRALAARLDAGGTVAINLFNDALLAERQMRLERVFDCTALHIVGANAIFHGRPHRRDAASRTRRVT
jgi:spermidine synthase